ncbi:hypothetical protein L484_023272 [Morus notabilis]|uniref:Uncharacterized protein n=1 Tax=Morus notabilis TaxID=981085 RepID=W9RWC0_9ROSA|nr:hypothetical protein L484_023272 [Morus notabilis]
MTPVTLDTHLREKAECDHRKEIDADGRIIPLDEIQSKEFPKWFKNKVVEHFRHRHIWDIPETDIYDVKIVQDTKSTNIELVVELPEIDLFVLNRDDGSSNVVTSDVDAIMKDKSPVVDDFINDEDDETLKEYVEEEVIESEDDDDINDYGDNQQFSRDDE